MEDILKKIGDLVAEGEEDEAVEAVREALKQGIEPLKVLTDGAGKGMDAVSEQYNAGEAFLPELVLAGDAMTAIMKIVFESMDEKTAAETKEGVVVIGQAKGDVHDIGKNICSALLAVNGFEVHDLGIDVPVKKFIEEAESTHADFILMSTLLTTSLPYLSDTLQYIKDTGHRDQYYFCVGGGPVTPEFAEKIGSNGWSRTAFDCVDMCKQLVKSHKAADGQFVMVDSEA